MKTNRKLISVILVLAVFAALFVPTASAKWQGDIKARCDTAAAPATAAIAYNVTDGQTLYVKNAARRVSVGSITKILTACVASQYFTWTDILTVGAEQYLVKSYASRAPVYSGQRYTFEQLLAAMLIPSGCDAAYAIAANTARKASGNYNMSASAAISYFAGMMNDFCRSVGCTDSYFINPDGQDVSGQHTTVSDYIKVATYAINNPIIASVVRRSYYVCWDQAGTKHSWSTTNSMVNPYGTYYYNGAVGMKTGSTPNAGGCLLCAVDKNGKMLITLVVGTYYTTSDYTLRFKTTHALLNVLEPYLARRGDINDDGKVDVTDARSALRISIGLDPYADTWVADLDLDGSITVSDARIILRTAIGLAPFASDAQSGEA